MSNAVMTHARKPVVPNKLAAVGTREWAAALLQQFGTELGTEYFKRQLTFDQASAEHASSQPRQRGGFANRLARSRVMRDLLEPEPQEEKPLTGFAAKLVFPHERHT